jgi:phospholipid/cholesterol/gamma-HCH transport system substrate-binding protein
MSESINKRAISVGIFTIIGIVLLVGGVLTVGSLHSVFQRKVMISTVFDDVNGLLAGSNIWFSGVKIGTVKSLEFYGNSQVKVTMNINLESKKFIRQDSKVKISTEALIGNKILVIYGGTSLSPEIVEGNRIFNEKMLSTEDIMNTFHQNNLNILALTSKLSNGEGTIGKLIASDSIYKSIEKATTSLKFASQKAQVLMNSLANYSDKLNKKGTLANELVSDTIIYNSMKISVLKLQKVTDSVSVFIENLKKVSKNPKSPVGILLQDEKTGDDLKTTISNLEIGSKKLNEDLEALQHSFLMRRYFKKEAEKLKKSKSSEK